MTLISGSQIDQEAAAYAEPTPPTQELPIQDAWAPRVVPFARQRRYRALAAAVRRHELASSRPSVPKRPADHALYAVLNELEAGPSASGDRP
jgi:hypothetical protein